MVAFGTLVSATWIISANSWMQTPVGFAMNAKGQFVPAGSWLPIIFNPSFPYRLVHTVIASYLDHGAHRRRRGRVASAEGSAQPARADHVLHGDVDGGAGRARADPRRRYAGPQHAAVSAGEGARDGRGFRAEPERCAAWCSSACRATRMHEVHDRIAIPKLGSLDPGARSEQSAPRTQGLSARSLAYGRHRLLVVPHHGRAWASRCSRSGSGASWPACAAPAVRFASGCTGRRSCMGPAGFVAVIAGWVTTEVGRQPYTVYGRLLTADVAVARSPRRRSPLRSWLFVAVYFTVFGAGAAYLLRMMGRLPSGAASSTRRTSRSAPPALHRRAPSIDPAAARHSTGEVSHELQRRPERRLGAHHRLRDFAYVVMDGFDLGIGILFPSARRGSPSAIRR